VFDVLFDIGKFSLKPGTREKGIVLAYPGLDIEVGGYTDNVEAIPSLKTCRGNVPTRCAITSYSNG
jgi:hypothetical protein